MKARLIRIGNSHGIRLPKPVIDALGLTEEVDMELRAGSLVIRPSRGRRAGWAEAAEALASDGGDRLPDAPTSTRFDEGEWTW
jgi:antitoxin MazE